MSANHGPEIEPNRSERAAAVPQARVQPPAEVEVLIAGAGPCGLMLAIELGRRGVRTLVVDPRQGTAFSPQANATQARTMEH